MAESTYSSPQEGTSTKVIQSVVSLPTTKLESIEIDESLPRQYGMDHLQLMVQSPFQVFVYWEVTPERIQEALTGFPKEDQGAFHVALRWIENGQSQLRTFDSGAASEWWFETRPCTRYQAVLCLHSEELGNITLLNSNEVETPSNSMEEIAVDIEEPEQTKEFLSRLIQLTGLTEDSTQPQGPSGSKDETEAGRQLPVEIETCHGPERPTVEMTRPTSSVW